MNGFQIGSKRLKVQHKRVGGNNHALGNNEFSETRIHSRGDIPNMIPEYREVPNRYYPLNSLPQGNYVGSYGVNRSRSIPYAQNPINSGSYFVTEHL